jgi:diguanylate cyclase (GGDEF)-like protein/PAS domain S-box-containing protein
MARAKGWPGVTSNLPTGTSVARVEESKVRKTEQPMDQLVNGVVGDSPILPNEQERLKALDRYGILDSSPEKAFDDITKIAAQICGAPISVVGFVDETRQWFKSTHGLEAKETPRKFSICAHTILNSELLVIPDTREDRRFAAYPMVAGEPGIRFYAGAPLETADGFRLGAVCVADHQARPEGLRQKEAEALLACARSVVAQLELRQAQRSLRQSEQRYRALVDASAVIEFRAAADGFVLDAQGWTEFCGQDRQAYKGHGWTAALHPEDAAAVAEAWKRLLASEMPGTNEYRVRVANGCYRWVLMRAVPLKDAGGTIREWVGTVADIHDQKLATEALRASEERFRLAAKASAESVWEWDLVSDRVCWREEGEPIFCSSKTPPENTGAWWRAHIHASDRERVIANLDGVIAGSGSHWSEEYRLLRPDGTFATLLDRGFVVRDAAGRALRIVGATQDVGTRKAAEDELWRAAYHDPLTCLPNRALLRARKREAIARAERNGTAVALIYLDLDDFKDVNDTLGHDAGDAVLLGVAERLKACAPAGATVARFGGDEFIVLLPDLSSTDGVEGVVRSLLACLEVPLRYGQHELTCRASAGVALYPAHEASRAGLLKNADIALYAAKKAGRNRYVFFSGDMRQNVQRRISVLRCVRDLLARGAIVPFYQPKVRLDTGAVTGFEALLRWKDASGRIQLPGAIKDAFEDPNLSVAIGRHMLDRITQDMKAWRSAGLAFGSIALNVAAAEFGRSDFAENILAKLREADLPTAALEVEITETVFLGDGSEAVGAALRRLHENGVSIALDDFGTGYASLTHLKKFPVSWLKIDRSFVQDLGENADGTAIVEAVIRLSHSLGIRVVAEGIETEAQLHFLRQEGCDLAQGFLLSKPMIGSRVPVFLASWQSLVGAPQSVKLVAAR